MSSAAPLAKAQDLKASNSRASSNNRAALFARAASADSDSHTQLQHEAQPDPSSVATRCAEAVETPLEADRRTASQTSSASVVGPMSARRPNSDRRTHSHLGADQCQTDHSVGSTQGSSFHTASIHDHCQDSHHVQNRAPLLVAQNNAALELNGLSDPPFAHASSCGSDSSLSLPHQGSAQYGEDQDEASSEDEEASSSRTRNLNTPEHKQLSALAYNQVLLELRQQQGVRQQDNNGSSSAASAVIGKHATYISL